jgi:hypothetical protein
MLTKNSGIGEVLQSCQLIIWDECMAHKKELEALNRTLKDLKVNEQLFGGALILMSGDFRQTLPVIPRSTPADELNACLKSSVLWPCFSHEQLYVACQGRTGHITRWEKSHGALLVWGPLRQSGAP